MVKTSYYIANIILSEKRNQVKINFRRIATQEELDELARQKADNKIKLENKPKGLTFFPSIFNNVDEEPSLNFDSIIFVLPLKDVQRLDLKIGMVTELNIPEEPGDIIIGTR